MEKKTRYSSNKTAFRVGTISFIFLVIGYELALFIHRASELRIQERRDHPDTVYVIDPSLIRQIIREEQSSMRVGASADPTTPISIRRNASHEGAVRRARDRNRRYESFHFNPNTATLDELMRLGFSEKQANSIINYRDKGGRFARKSDFAKSFVVADSVYKRLEPYIDIPLLDINLADSAAFDALPGIGGFFAGRMVKYREELGGYSCSEQLMEIWKFDSLRFNGLKDLIFCSEPSSPLDLWGADEETLRAHPHIRNRHTARSIVLYRKTTSREQWSITGLLETGIINSETALKLSRCKIKEVP